MQIIYTIAAILCLLHGIWAQTHSVTVDTFYIRKDATRFNIPINWQTSHEFNMGGFALECSYDGRLWQVLSFTPNHVQPPTRLRPNPYGSLDRTRESDTATTVLYRLRLVEKHNYYTLSPVVWHKCRDSLTFQAQYNPQTQLLSLQTPQRDTLRAQLEILAGTTSPLTSQQLIFINGRAQLPAALANGFYTLRINDPRNPRTWFYQKLVVVP